MFISDIHVGEASSRYSDALRVIVAEEPDELYLLGDILDLWQVRYEKLRFKHFSFLHELFQLSGKMEITYILGNHDLDVPTSDTFFTKCRFSESDTIRLYNNKSLRIIHGHKYDNYIMKFFPLAKFLSWVQGVLLRVYGIDFRKIRFSLSRKRGTTAFGKVLGAVKEHALEENQDVDILIMGHTHIPEDSPGTPRYMNCGDWIEDKTYIIEERGKLCLKKSET